MFSFLNVIFAVILYFHLSSAKVVVESINDLNADWEFVTRFCFLSEDGAFSYKINFPQNYGPYKLLLYYDSEIQWDTVYQNNDMTCHEKLQSPQIEESKGQIINLEPFAYTNAGNCTYVWPNGNTTGDATVHCELTRTFRSVRQRWWYIAVSRCNESIDYARGGRKGIVFDYDLLLTNGDTLFFKHFSADEFYILQVDITFLLVTALLLFISIICAVKLQEMHFLHTTYKLYLFSLVLQTIYLFLITICLGVYANDGVERYGFEMFARVFEIAAYLLYVLILILMGKGWTITRGKIRKTGVIKIIIFFILYIIGFIILYVFEARFMDPGKVLYIYESLPGYVLIAMRLLAWAWFSYGIIFTLKHYPEKKKFYIPFFILITVWFMAGPIVILTANFAMAAYVRATVVNAIEIFTTTVGYFLFLFLTLPWCVNIIFPFHIKTTQIDVLPADQYPHEKSLVTNDQQLVYSNRNGNVLSLPSHDSTDLSNTGDHAPAAHITPNGAPNFRDLFVTSYTHSIVANNPPPAYGPVVEEKNTTPYY